MQQQSLRCLLLVACSAAAWAPTQARAQDSGVAEEVSEDQGPEASFGVSLNQDIFFGFHVVAQVGVSLTELLDVTFYSILWTRNGLGGDTGTDLWTEWGGGVNLNLLDGNLSINPQFGILNGTLLSGANRGLFVEGIVPNLTVNYGDGLFEGQVYAGFYIGLRTQGDSSNNDFIHYWASFGVAPLSWLSVGAYWEHLIQNRGLPDGADQDLYQWIGPYVEARASIGFIRLAGGADVSDSDVGDFYKASIGATFD